MFGLYQCLELIINFFESYIWYKTTDSFLLKKYNNYVIHISQFILWVLLSIKSAVGWYYNNFYSVFFFGVCIVFIIISTTILFRDKLKIKLLIAFLYIIVVAVVNLLIIIILLFFLKDLVVEDFSTVTLYRIGTELFSKVILFFLVEFFSRSRKEILILERKFSNAVMLMVSVDFVLLVTVYVIYNKTKYLTSETSLLFISLSVLLITIFFILVLSRLAKSYKEIMNERLKANNMKMKLQIHEDMSIVSQNLRELRHDMNNHIAVMYGLINTKQYKNLEKYIKELNSNLSYANFFIILENEALSIILNVKKAFAKEKDIEFQYSIMIKHLELTDIEICSLFGNLIDNAIEAAEKVEGERLIELNLRENETAWFISCENPYKVKPVFKNGMLISTKTDSKTHGFGTQNISEIVKKYNGTLGYKILGDIFEANIVIPK